VPVEGSESEDSEEEIEEGARVSEEGEWGKIVRAVAWKFPKKSTLPE
jgi:hypothetical protein